MATGPDGEARHEVCRGLALVREGLARVLDASMLSLSDDEVRAALEEATGLQASGRAAYLRLLAESARRDDPARADGSPGTETTGWLAGRARMSTGRVQVDLHQARVLDPETGDLSALGRELAEGAVTAEHAAIAVRAVGDLPAGLVRQRRADVDALLTGHARRFAPPTTRKLARHLIETVDPDRAYRVDEQAFLRRELYVGTDATGMVCASGRLEPAGGATFKALIDHLAAPHRGSAVDEDGQAALDVTDARTPAQRRADALTEMATLAAGALGVGVRAGERPRVVVHTTVDQLSATRRRVHEDRDGGRAARGGGHAAAGPATCEQTGPLTPGALARLACDAVLDRVLLDRGGRVLEMTSLGRFFTAAQRRALAARDGGCAFPGCDRPPAWTDAHHVTFWVDGGPTAVGNGVLVCGPHHTAVHAGGWTIVVRDGVPWFVPPRHVDPLQRPLRNTVHQAIARTRRAAQQLALGLPLGTETDPDG